MNITLIIYKIFRVTNFAGPKMKSRITKFVIWKNCLHISRIFTYFAYRLHIIRLYNLMFDAAKLLKISDMCNFYVIILLKI